MKEEVFNCSNMIVFLLAVIGIETIAIALFIFFVLKRFKRFKKSEDNFVTYLDELDKTNDRLKKELFKLRSAKKLER